MAMRQKTSVNELFRSSDDEQEIPPQKKAKKNSESVKEQAGGAPDPARLAALNSVLREVGKQTGLSLELMEKCQKHLDVAEERGEFDPNDPEGQPGYLYMASVVQTILQIDSALALPKLVSKVDKLTNEVDALKKVVGTRQAGVAVNDECKLESEAQTAINRLTFAVFFSPVVSAWSKHSTQVMDITLQVLNRHDYGTLRKFVGERRIDDFKKSKGQETVKKVIRAEVNRIREQLMRVCHAGSGLDETIGEDNKLSIIDLAVQLVGKKGIPITQDLLHRLSLFRCYVVNGEARVKKPQLEKTGETTEMYRNNTEFFQSVDIEMKKKIEETARKHASVEARRDSLRKFLDKMFKKDLEDYPCQVEIGELDAEGENAKEIEEVGKSMEAEGRKKKQVQPTQDEDQSEE